MSEEPRVDLSTIGCYLSLSKSCNSKNLIRVIWFSEFSLKTLGLTRFAISAATRFAPISCLTQVYIYPSDVVYFI